MIRLTHPHEDSPVNKTSIIATENADDISGNAHRQLIGWLGIALPFLLLLVAGLRPLEAEHRWTRLDSLSAYYHSSAVVVFVGILIALGLFLLTYQGFNNEDRRKDRRAAIIAGSAAIGVAVFPTSVPEGYPDVVWLRPWESWIHYASAAILLLTFSYFSLFLFTKGRQPLRPEKRVENLIYRICGIIIVVSLIGIAILHAFGRKDIFWPEAIAIWAFAISWLLKGRVDHTFKALARKVSM